MVARVLTLVMAMLLLVGSVVAPRGAAAAGSPAEPAAALVEALTVDEATVPPAMAPAGAPATAARALAMPVPRQADGRLHAITIFRPPR